MNRDSAWLEPGQKRCEYCGGSGANPKGDFQCPVCNGWGAAPDDPASAPLPSGTICRADGRPGTDADPVVSDGQIHRSCATQAQASYRDRLAVVRGARP